MLPRSKTNLKEPPLSGIHFVTLITRIRSVNTDKNGFLINFKIHIYQRFPLGISVISVPKKISYQASSN
jgi:hypothetical protein